MCIASIFSCSLYYLFILDSVLSYIKVFNFISFVFCCLYFWCHIQETITKAHGMEIFLLSSKIFTVLTLISGCLIYKELVFYMVYDKSPASFFYILISSFSALFVEEVVSSLLNDLDTMLKNTWHVCKSLFLGSLFYPFVYISVFMPGPYCFDHGSFVVRFEAGWVTSPILFPFIKIILAV